MNINLTIKNVFIILRFVRYNTGWVGVVQDSVAFNVVMVCGECVFSLKVNFSFPLKWEKWEKFHSLFNYSFICFHFILFDFILFIHLIYLMRRNKHAHLFPTQCSVIRPLMKTHGSGNGTYRLMNKASIEVANNNKLSEMEKEFQVDNIFEWMNEWINCVQDQIRSACLSVCVGQAIFSAFAHFKLRFSFFIYFFGLFFQQHIQLLFIEQ